MLHSGTLSTPRRRAIPSPSSDRPPSIRSPPRWPNNSVAPASSRRPRSRAPARAGGIKLFCNGVGPQFPDVANASRRIRPAELQTCAQNGVKEVVEVKVGYDGIVIAESKTGNSMNAHPPRRVPGARQERSGSGESTTLVANPFNTWKDVNKSLPAVKIEVLGPPPTSGTRDSFVELYMEAGCRTSPGWTRCAPRTNRASSAPAAPCAKTACTSRPARTTTNPNGGGAAPAAHLWPV